MVIFERNTFLAELIGTFALVFVGCSAIVVSDIHPAAVNSMGIAAVFGLVVMSMIYAVGNVSGAHFNPAVSIAFTVAGRLPKEKLISYIMAQCLGAIFAASIILLLFPHHETLGSTLPNADIWRVFLLEVILTFFLMFVILNVATGYKEKGIMAGVAVGGIVGLEALFAGPITGASMNPARSLGPALLSQQWATLWLYIFAPIIGALLATPTCRWVQGDDCCP